MLQSRLERIKSPMLHKVMTSFGPIDDLFKQPLPEWTKEFPSPINDYGLEVTAKLMLDSVILGDQHLLITEWTNQFKGNFVVPITTVINKSPNINFSLVVVNSEDHYKLGTLHVKKSTAYSGILFSNHFLSTTDLDEWRTQRRHFIDGVMPMTVLQHFIPIINQTSQELIEKIHKGENSTFFYVSEPSPAYNMHELIADTAFIILLRTLFGEEDQFIFQNSRRVRWALQHPEPGNKLSKAILDQWTSSIIQRGQARKQSQTNQNTGNDTSCPVRGRLLNRVLETEQVFQTSIGTSPEVALHDNIAILSLAGQDTTATTMTFLLMELAKNKSYQDKVRKEIDELAESLQGRQIQYTDLPKLRFLTQCINETLRLWSAVPYGTFRELQFNEKVTTPLHNGLVSIPKQTSLVLHNYSLHRKQDLWGENSDKFIPERWNDGIFIDEWTGEEDKMSFNFSNEEIGCPFSGRNPQSLRFHPFTRGPRDCFGKNFAQLEIRLVIFNLLREFEFRLASPTISKLKKKGDQISFMSAGILKPRDGMWLHAYKRQAVNKTKPSVSTTLKSAL
eukprot:c18437_g1_i1.p1 GENE.c18437_g1_i1~~c18437_g1_i1.p1  ORF type:complete len:562 (+),score=181.64 c18437_g1_i1:47-1732(+)